MYDICWCRGCWLYQPIPVHILELPFGLHRPSAHLSASANRRSRVHRILGLSKGDCHFSACIASDSETLNVEKYNTVILMEEVRKIIYIRFGLFSRTGFEYWSSWIRISSGKYSTATWYLVVKLTVVLKFKQLLALYCHKGPPLVLIQNQMYLSTST